MQASPPLPARRLPAWGWVVLIGGAVLACYWPALHGGLVWDDAAHVTRPELRSLAGLGRIWTDLHQTQQYYPVLHSAFWIEHRLWGDATLGYHLLNVILHAASCCLLAFLLRRLWQPGAAGQRRVPAGVEWWAALLFAVHPVCVESVAWISEQKNTLSLFLYLLAALAYLHFAANRRPATYVRALLLFLLALGTKTVTATLPAALLVVLWWRDGRLEWKRDVRPLLPWFVVAVAAGLFTAWVERTIVGAEGASYELAAGERVLLADRVIWFYLGKLVWPADLQFVYPHWDVPAAPGWTGWLIATLAVTFGLWLLRRRTRGPLAGWFIFTGTLFPALGFFNLYPFVYSYVADHFQYAASLGIITLAAAGAGILLGRIPPGGRIAGKAAGVLLLAGLAVLANRQSGIYRDEETLYRATLARNPGAWMAHHNLANLLRDQPGRAAEAAEQYEAALRLRPGHYIARVNYGNLLAREPGHQAEALAQFEEAIRLKPDYAEAHNYLANLLAQMPGRQAEALAHYAEALRLKPDYAAAHSNLADLLATLPGRRPEALAQYAEALRLDPNFAVAHNNLANQLAQMPGHDTEAIAHYEDALRINPNLAPAHHNLAIVLARQGRVDEALAHCRRALELDPDYADARRTMAYLQSLKPGR